MCRCRRSSLVALAIAPGAHRIAPLRLARAIEHQDAVEMIDLVRQHARLETRRLNRHRRAVLVGTGDAQMDEPLDVDADSGNAQAPLLERLGLLAVPLDLRVDQGDSRA